MIPGRRHKGLARFFETGSTASIQVQRAPRLRLILSRLGAATVPQNLALPGLALHPLNGDERGRWAVSVSGNWHVTFEFAGKDPDTGNYEDYHCKGPSCACTPLPIPVKSSSHSALNHWGSLSLKRPKP
ncbi:MAG: peptidase [Nitrospira sp.]|nr:peptidase [Nitrospira sp.]